MEKEKDIHNYQADVDRYLERIETSSEIKKQNKQDLQRYAKSMQDLSTGTQSKNLQVMLRISKEIKNPFKKATKEDIDNVMDEVLGLHLTTWSKAKYRSCLKKFYKWLYNLEDSYPTQVSHLRSKKPKQKGVPTDRLTLEDLKALIQAAQNPRDKFIIAALTDLGCRIGELGSMNIENVEDRLNYLMYQITDSKTMPRNLPVKNSRPYLLDYLKVHSKNKPGEPLLVDKKGNRLSYDVIRRVLIDVREKAGITKPCNPHHIRRSVATIYGQYFHENEMDKWFGWGKQKMSNVYVSFSGKQLLESYNKFWESDKNTLRQIVCPVCHTLNAGILEYCNQCKKPLLEKTVLNASNEINSMATEVLNKLITNNAMKAEIVKVVQEKYKKEAIMQKTG